MRENEALRGRVRELKLEAAEATAAARDDIDRLTARARTLELQDNVWARENTELKATLDAQVREAMRGGNPPDQNKEGLVMAISTGRFIPAV